MGNVTTDLKNWLAKNGLFARIAINKTTEQVIGIGTMAKIDFRKQILKEMKKRKISIPAMSRIIGCNQQTLYDFFSGRKALGADYLQAVLNELDGKLTF